MKRLHYSVEVRDNNGKLYKTDKGTKVLNFTFEDDLVNEPFAEAICRNEYEKYKAICKENSIIDIEVKLLDEISFTYSLLYSFYGAENKFIKH